MRKRSLSLLNSARKVSSDNVVSLLLISLILATALACGRFMPSAPVVTNQTNTNAPTTSNPEADKAFKELLDKKSEFAKIDFPVKLVPDAKITGKAIVVGNESKLDGRKFLSSAREAKNLAELQNIIQIVCSKGKYVGNYAWNGSSSKSKGYASDCKVSLIDHKASAVIAQKTFSNSVASDIVLPGHMEGGDVLMARPLSEIVEYVFGFQYDKIIPSSSLEDKELMKAATTAKPDPNAGLRGKIAIVAQFESGGISVDNYVGPSFNLYDTYGLPKEKFTNKYDDLETLVRIDCKKGNAIGDNQGAKQYSSKCDVSLIDFKTMTVMSQKTIENKTIDPKITKDVAAAFVVSPPKDLIGEYLKTLPAA